MLRHRQVLTTAIYAKVDRDALRQLARPWPETGGRSIALEDRLAGYLAVRRALGYRLARAEKLLAQFIGWMNERGETTITTGSALAWATLPPATESNWHAHRLSVVRSFAAHLHALDPAHELVPQDLLPQRPRRAVPYLYTDAEIRALMATTCVIPTPHRAATMRALIGLRP